MADENEVGNIYEPTSCRNFDVAGSVDRLDRTLYELCTCESAMTNDFNQYDMERFLTNINEVNAYIKAISAKDRLDLPHSFPAQYTFRFLSKDAEVQWEAVKNTFVRDLARLTANAMVQWSRSESADASNKFIPADEARWDLIYERMNAMVKDFSDLYIPGDKPESSDFELGKRGAGYYNL